MKRYVVAQLAVIVAWLLICLRPAPAQSDQGGVRDAAHVLNADGIAAIAAEINKADAVGVSIDVLLLDRLEDSIERVARQRATEWTPTHSKAAVLVIAIGDRQSRLEVNDALRPQLPDARSQFALDSARPYLRDKNYSGAIVYVIGQVAAAASGAAGPAEDPTGETVQRKSQHTAAAAHHAHPEDRGDGWMIFGIVLGIITASAALVGYTRYSRQLVVVDGKPRAVPYWRQFIGGYGAVFAALFTALVWIIKVLAEGNKSSYSSSSSWSSSSSRGTSSSFSSHGSSGSGGGFSGGGASSSW